MQETIENLTQKEVEAFTQKVHQATVGALDSIQSATVQKLHPAILHILAEGRPVAPSELAAVVKLPVKKVAEMLAELPSLERDEQGCILGFGLTLVPTPHQVRLHHHDTSLYAWCAPDALILPSLIGEQATITSPCQATQRQITVEVGKDGVQQVDPPEAVVSWWLPGMYPNDLRGSGCVNQNLFSSATVAAEWRQAHPGATLMSVTDTFRALTFMSRLSYGGECAA